MATTSGHTIKAFDEDLDRLRALISQMGGLAEHAIRESLRCLVQRDLEGAQRIVEDDKKLDALDLETERRAVQFIALRAPMAGDLRDVVAALKISSVVERIELLVIVDDLLRPFEVALHEAAQGFADGMFGQPAHLADERAQSVQVLVERLDRMSAGGRHFVAPISRSGR